MSEILLRDWKVGLQQRVLPDYRAPFFEALARRCQAGLSVFVGQPLAGEGILLPTKLEGARLYGGKNLTLFNPASPFFLCWQRGLFAWLREWKPDVLIVEANPRILSTRKAVRWMRQRGGLVIGWGLGAPPLTGKFAWLRRKERHSFLSLLDGIIAYSRRGAREYQAEGMPPQRVFVALNSTLPCPLSLPLRRPRLSDKPMRVLFVGRLQKRKRVDLLLQACAGLSAELRPQVTIVGDGPARAEFEAIARQVYPEAVFTGDQRGSALESEFASADVFVLPGTGGLAVQQAMAFGLPVIVAQGDGTQEDLVRPENGWLIPPDDLSALTSALAEALKDEERLRRMGRESFRIVREEANVEKMAETFISAIETLNWLKSQR
ncbi:MAG: glycosyltransferase family 4 protein [Chloroflexota bacterium]